MRGESRYFCQLMGMWVLPFHELETREWFKDAVLGASLAATS